MTPEEFQKTVEAMAAIPPAHRKRLMELAPMLTDAERTETVAALQGSNQRIGTIADDMTKTLDQGMAALDRYQKTEVATRVGKAEEEDRKAADKILDDASGTART